MELSEAVEFLQEINENKALISVLLDESKSIIDLFGPELKTLLERSALAIADIEIKVYHKYVKAGISPEDAIKLLVNKQSMYNFNKKY